MNSSIFRFTLDLHRTQSQISIPVMRGDTGRTFRINLSDGGNPYIIEDGCLAKLSIKRPTRSRLEEFCAVEDNTTIVYSFEQNINTAISEGIHECDITLYGLDGKILGTAMFTMVVSERVVRSNDIVLTDEDFTAVDAMLKQEAARQLAEAERKEAETQRREAENERITAGEVALKAVSDARAEAERAENAATVAVERASEVATEEAMRIIGELGVVQTPGDSPTAVMSQKATTDIYNRNDKRITNLEQGLPEDNFITDDSVAYVKDVPSNALPFAEIKKVGGMTYKEGNTLKHAKVTEIESVGVNLIKYLGVIPHSKTKNGVTYTVNEDYSITINGTPTQDQWVVLSDISTNNTQWNEATAKPIPHDYYTASMEVISGSHNYTYGVICVGFYTPSSAEGTTTLELKDTQSITSPHIATKINSIYVVAPTGTVFNNFTFKLQVQRGTQATEIILPTVRTIEIPTAVQTLDGYGVGVSDEYYNYIDWESKVFIKRVERVELDGTEEIVQSGTGTEGKNRFFVRIDSKIKGDIYTRIGVCNLFPVISTEETWMCVNGIAFDNEVIWFYFDEIQTWDALKNLLERYNAEGTPVTVEYPLLEPQYIDISKLITADNFIEVEGGGTITAVNENSLAVPSEIEYQVEV